MPKQRQRDAAETLGVSEGALVHARASVGEMQTLNLREGGTHIVEALPAVGRVMALTRNAHCVHEKYGTFGGVDLGETMGQVLMPDIDLRLFLNHWKHAFAVTEETRSGERHSIQFYDGQGDAVLKVYAVEETDTPQWNGLNDRFSCESTNTAFVPAELPAKAAARPDAEVDVTALRTAWMALEHTHDFFIMLRRQKVTRLQALRLAGDDLAERLSPDAIHSALTGASQVQVPIMCFVGNRGGIQIHTGAVKRIEVMGPWVNVLDSGFNLHLRQDAIAEVWLVRKPTSYGTITSLEAYDERGEIIVQLFGQRNDEGRERGEWRAVLADFVVNEAQEVV
ncbi:UNVERIFIED_CONTAM: hypothetical protein GTU68_008577 [Idotea baltica]|nr:hypothetical protein [Idotea baltica]